ncbi:MAG: carboxypeptidase-like regulatory domain-containing protein, partial [Candidatus Omnitrophica bacterium]|nr:carboxypeptidase-like regulatory domain-containing protein [Candidatus Omnitrophota bacterium]
FRGAKVQVELDDLGVYDNFSTSKDGRVIIPFTRSKYATVRLVCLHPDYLLNSVAWTGSETARLPAQYELELTRGVRVAGVVRDGSGKPIAGAEVLLGSGISQRYARTAFTSAKGGFVLTGATPGQTRLIVRANGYAPIDMVVVVQEGMRPAMVAMDRTKSRIGLHASL